MMEADSTTYDNSQKANSFESLLPFPVHPGNLKLYKEITELNEEGTVQQQLVRKLQDINLLPKTRQCSNRKPDCCMTCMPARVVDRLQWVCNNCNNMRLPVRGNSFFLRIHCTLLQSLQMILAWCEDAEWEVAAKHFDVKPKVAYYIYDKLDQLSIDEHTKHKLGGENGVVLAEMYPDCLNRLSPDTTDTPHVHRVLMLADTNHIPTRYWLHVIKDTVTPAEVNRVVKKVVDPGSTLVVGNYVPMISDAVSLQTLTQHCDAEMQHFLCERIWRQAVLICSASRDICAGGACTTAVQKYLSSALYRLQHGDGFYHHILTLIATQYTKEDPQHLMDESQQSKDDSLHNIEDSRCTTNANNSTKELHHNMDDSNNTKDNSNHAMDDSNHTTDSSNHTKDSLNHAVHNSKHTYNFHSADVQQLVEEPSNHIN